MLEWLEIARNQAEERFRSLPFPSPKDENFRFTPLAYSEPAPAAAGAPVSASLSVADAEEASVLTLDGEDATSTGSVGGAMFTDVLRAATLGSEVLRARLREIDAFRDDKFAQLTSARWKNGAFLHVPAGVKVAKPVRFVAAARGSEEHFRHVMVLEEGAEATVVQELWSDDASRFVGELCDVRLGRNSRLNWIVLQSYGEGTSYVARQRVEIAAGATLTHSPLHLGGKLVQVRQETHLAGETSALEALGAARGHGQQHFDFWLDARHEGARSRSQMDYYYVMAGKARGVFNAQIEVKHGVSECESSQRAKSLLLGGGTVHSIPKLLIKTDAVKAAHGASVASVSGEQLHYLQSRGIPRGDAERMIVRGFTEAVVDRLPTEALRGRADTLLDRKQGGDHA
jgi:Fe-S cluster assembly protein SufD